MSGSRLTDRIKAIRTGLEITQPPGHFEIRVLGGAKVLAGVFDTADTAAQAIAGLNGRLVQGAVLNFYATLNPCQPSLVDRLPSALRPARTTTRDDDILQRSTLLIDLDPVRPAHTASTDEELEAARERAQAVQAHLSTRAWAEPIAVMSGNGINLRYRIDLENDDEANLLVTAVLRELARRFSDDSIRLDTAVGNAARIAKVIGTVARKGVPTKERPHRTATLLDVPTTRGIVTRQQLEALLVEDGACDPQTRTSARSVPTGSNRPGDDFNARGNWMRDVLGPAHWTLVGTRADGVSKVRRPGKDSEHSATLYYGGTDFLYVFTDATPLAPNRAYSKFSAFGLLHFGGDFAAAARELLSRGYGGDADVSAPYPPPPPPPSSSSTDAANDASSSSAPTGRRIRPETRPPFPEPDPAMFHGFLGEIVRGIDPTIEASLVCTLGQLVVVLGSVIGRGPQAAHVRVDGHKAHYLNEYTLIVGPTGLARKQTALERVLLVCEPLDPTWRHTRGVISGEGLIWDIRDATTTLKGGRTITDVGVDDKRYCVVEEEFSRVLAVGRRDGSTLLETLREAWDANRLKTGGKHHPAAATAPHVSVVGHCTQEVLATRMRSEDFASGLANRFIHLAVAADKVLADPQALDASVLAGWRHRLDQVIEHGQTCGELRRTPTAQALWTDVYAQELRRPRRGLLAKLCVRAPSHVMRLAGLYAVAEQARVIDRDVLEASLAFWRYAEQSLQWIYGLSITGSPTADALLRELRVAGTAGLTKGAMFAARLGRSAADLDRDLTLLQELHLADGWEEQPAVGRPIERWQATKPADGGAP